MKLLPQVAALLACLSCQCVVATPLRAGLATILRRQADIKAEYDYVIVGGGTAGLTVGDRLSESGKHSVLVLEHGKLDDQNGFPYEGPNSPRVFNLTSVPQSELNDRAFWVGIGKVVGGSSNVNGQVFIRGTKEEYDIWKKLGGARSTWDWKGLLPYFKKGIYFTPPDAGMAEEFNVTYDPTVWGQNSKTHIYATYSNSYSPIMKLMYSAMKNMPGVDVPRDGAAGTNGLFWYTTAMDPKTFLRSYSRTGHWDGLNRKNYELSPETKVTKLTFKGRDVTGVEFTAASGGSVRRVRARKEVILAAGAIHSPQILQLSGIGPKKLLEDAKIPLKMHLPGVGSNFQDHSYIPFVSYQWGRQPPTPPLNHPIPTGGTNPVLGTFIGLPAVSPSNFAAIAQKFAKQDPAAYLPPSTHPHVLAGYARQKALWARAMLSPGVTFFEYILNASPTFGAPQNLHPMSRGTVTIDPANPSGPMRVDYRGLSNPIDLDIMVEILKFIRRYMTTGELEQYAAVETIPGPTYDTDEKLATWARSQINPSVFHPVGTTAMMKRELGGVVDDELLVYGVKRLSVVDAGIMPTTLGATPSMTVYAIAEKAADLIKSRARRT